MKKPARRFPFARQADVGGIQPEPGIVLELVRHADGIRVADRQVVEEVGIGLEAGTINWYEVVFVTQNFAKPNALERSGFGDGALSRQV